MSVEEISIEESEVHFENANESIRRMFDMPVTDRTWPQSAKADSQITSIEVGSETIIKNRHPLNIDLFSDFREYE
jgi:hypothetical protein